VSYTVRRSEYPTGILLHAVIILWVLDMHRRTASGSNDENLDEGKP
jgi:hypothetical protein